MHCATFNSDARFIAGAGVDGVVRVWDVKSSRVRRTFDTPVGISYSSSSIVILALITVYSWFINLAFFLFLIYRLTQINFWNIFRRFIILILC